MILIFMNHRLFLIIFLPRNVVLRQAFVVNVLTIVAFEQ